MKVSLYEKPNHPADPRDMKEETKARTGWLPNDIGQTGSASMILAGTVTPANFTHPDPVRMNHGPEAWKFEAFCPHPACSVAILDWTPPPLLPSWYDRQMKMMKGILMAVL